MWKHPLSIVAFLAFAALQPGLAQPPQNPTEAGTITLDAQGHDPRWEENPHMREFYALTVSALRGPVETVDVADYERRAYAIFRAFATSLGVDPVGMIEHLKDIPRQMVGIVRDDATVLDSYEAFLVALRGPR